MTIDLNYLDYGGDGDPLVLIHGINHSLESFQHLFESLAQFVHVYAVDLRGHGQSGWADNQYRAIDYADDVIEFLTNVVDHSPVLLGHSLGAVVAAYIACRSDINIRGLILEEPMMVAGKIPPVNETMSFPFYQQRYALLKKHQANQGSVDDLYAILSKPLNQSGITLADMFGEAYVQMRAQQLHQTDPDTWNAILEDRFFEGFDPASELPTIQAPTHIITGDASVGAIPKEWAKSICQAIPSCTLSIYENTGHDVHTQAAERVINEVRTFVSQRVRNKS